MKRICAVIGVVIGAVAGLVAPAPPHVALDFVDAPVAAGVEHVHPDVVIPEGAVVLVTFGGDSIVTPEQAAELRPDLFEVERAEACYISPNRGSYIKATCQAYSGFGSRGFQVIGRAWNRCKTYIIVYGTIGSAPTRSSYAPPSGPGTFLPFPWIFVDSWIKRW